MVWCTYKNRNAPGNSCEQTALVLHLFHICHGGGFLSFLSRIGVFVVGKRYFYRSATQRFRFIILLLKNIFPEKIGRFYFHGEIFTTWLKNLRRHLPATFLLWTNLFALNIKLPLLHVVLKPK